LDKVGRSDDPSEAGDMAFFLPSLQRVLPGVR
jgi:hypothetical protein